MKPRLLYTGYATGEENMAIDEAIAAYVKQSPFLLTLRFYGWLWPTVSIGYFQKINNTPLLDCCQRNNIPVVRRPTGGRAVLHHLELTYSIALSTTRFFIGESIAQCYKFISFALIAGLKRLGLKAQFQQGDKKRLDSAHCFSISSLYEIGVGGRKLIGSAQLRRGDILLQHGSLLLDVDLDLLCRLFSFSDFQEEKETFKQKILKELTTLRWETERNWEVSTVAKEMALGFAEVFSFSFVEEALSPEEEKMAHRLEKEKFSFPQWTFRR